MTKNLTIGITGAGGFLGAATLARLLREPDLTLRAHFARPTSVRPVSNAQFVWGELAEAGVCASTVSGVDTLFHFATRGFATDSGPEALADNMKTSGKLLDAMARAGCQRLILASTGGAIYRQLTPTRPLRETDSVAPSDRYSEYKLAIECMAQERSHALGIELCNLRISNPYGPGQYGRTRQGILGVAVRCALEDQPLKLWVSPETEKDFLYVEDLTELFARMVTGAALAAGTYNVGSGRATPLSLALAEVEKATGRAIRIERVEGHALPTTYTALDTTKLRASVGWQPSIALDEGIRRLVEACRSRRAA